jgi:hypothetical protein
MAIKKNLIEDLVIQVPSLLNNAGLNNISDLFKPEEVLSDDRSITILKSLKILGFHKRVCFVEKESQKNSIFTESFSVTVPAGTQHIQSSIEDLFFTYGELKVTLLGKSDYTFIQEKARRNELSLLGVSIVVDKIGDLQAGGGTPPQLVRKADIRVNLVVHSGKSIPSYGAACQINLLFLGEE